MKNVIVMGAGDHAVVVAETAKLAGWTVFGHLAPQSGDQTYLGPYLGLDAPVMNDPSVFRKVHFTLGVGFVDTASRAVFDRISTTLLKSQRPLATIVHPSAVISPSATIHDGAFVAANVVIGTRTTVAATALINTGSIIDHDCVISRGVHIGVAARLCGRVHVGKGSLVGAGAVVRQNIQIGEYAVVGAGSVVVKSVRDKATVFGVAASERGAGSQ